NRVYADRMGNGSEESGDGYRYRGRGFIQLTGKDNYQKIGDRIGLDLVSNPDKVSQDVEIALRVAADFWDSRNLNKYADKDDIRAVTRRINGGYNGLEDRQKLLARARAIWG
ncbi:MAG: glycoside hydrolase family 19 protein, partial [Alphaproteobacteria bacterium]|nr:glycoside hydrolase family 19 protein [Alphaproteobacteria bacterium]